MLAPSAYGIQPIEQFLALTRGNSVGPEGTDGKPLESAYRDTQPMEWVIESADSLPTCLVLQTTLLSHLGSSTEHHEH
jgi:hypothetical protein